MNFDRKRKIGYLSFLPANCMTLSLTVGDPSGSNSERWNLEVVEDGSGTAVVRH